MKHKDAGENNTIDNLPSTDNNLAVKDNSIEADGSLENKELENTSNAQNEEGQESHKEHGSAKSNIIFKIFKTIPRQIKYLCLRILITAVLFIISCIFSLNSNVKLVLHIVAFFVSIVDVLILCFLDLLHRQFLSYNIIFSALEIATFATGHQIEACIVAYIYSAFSNLFSLISNNRFRNTCNILEVESMAALKLHHGYEKSARVKNVIGELKSGGFSDLRVFSHKYSIYSIVIILIAIFVSVIIPLLDKMQFQKWIYRGAIIASFAAVIQVSEIIIDNYAESCKNIFINKIYFSSVEDLRSASMLSSIVFNKTGTLTIGNFEVENAVSDKLTEEQLLFLACYADAYSQHPLSKALRKKLGREINTSIITDHAEEEGQGSYVEINNTYIVSIGNAEFMEKHNVRGSFTATPNTSAFIAVGNTCVGYITFSDRPKNEAADAILQLKQLDVANIAIMTGDNTLAATNLGRTLGISEIYADYQPIDKIQRMQYIISTLEKDDCISYVGNGKNDSELLNMVNLGIVLDADDLSDISLPEVIIGANDLRNVSFFFKAAKRLHRSLRLKMIITIGMNLLFSVLAILGLMFLLPALFVSFILQLFYIERPSNLLSSIKSVFLDDKNNVQE